MKNGEPPSEDATFHSQAADELPGNVHAIHPGGDGDPRHPQDPPDHYAPQSWEEVARDYGSMLYALSYRLTGNPDDARDLVQDVLLKVNKSLSTFRPGSFKGWLYRITVNAFYDRKRREKRIRFQALPDDMSRFAEGELAPDPAESLAKVRLDDDIQEAICDLPEEFKAAVVLCDVVGLSYEEIAEQTGVAIGTVRSRIHRGRAQLRRRLAHRLQEV